MTAVQDRLAAAKAAAAAASNRDLTKPQEGGGAEPPAAGVCRLRLVGYIETGVHTSEYQGTAKTKPRCEITFELSGPKHEPKKSEDGTLRPHLQVIRETIGYHVKSNYMKIFSLLNNGGEATNYLDLLDTAYIGNITHVERVKPDGTKKTFANLKKDGAYQIKPTVFEDAETGETRTVKVNPAVSPVRWFLWDAPTLEDFDALFVAGTYDDGGTKNKLQQAIVTAENFEGSPIQRLLLEAGREIPVFDKTEPVADEDDADATPTKAPAKAADKPKAVTKPKVAKTPAKPTTAPAEDDADPLAAFG